MAFFIYSDEDGFKWVNRRSQRKSYNWAQFLRFILFNPLPKPRIYHSLYNLNP